MLFDVLVNKLPIKQLCNKYQLSKETITEKVRMLKEQMQENKELLIAREHSNLKGIKK